ncbi:hypothetical protein BMS3Abin10_01112 [bacterium BMS3Abin10]|nr:hypothetical protein BMS3Abin10_01112 [bacterium BMS3Abin10]GBE38140.1 hypothetical protein BMS3Bbin08_00742 [bacterium BMS3Bbin08]
MLPGDMHTNIAESLYIILTNHDFMSRLHEVCGLMRRLTGSLIYIDLPSGKTSGNLM